MNCPPDHAPVCELRAARSGLRQRLRRILRRAPTDRELDAELVHRLGQQPHVLALARAESYARAWRRARA